MFGTKKHMGLAFAAMAIAAAVSQQFGARAPDTGASKPAGSPRARGRHLSAAQVKRESRKRKNFIRHRARVNANGGNRRCDQ